MRGLDITKWSLLDWTAAACFLLGALVVTLNAALRDAPALTADLPQFIKGGALDYLALPLVLVGFVLLFVRAKARPEKAEAGSKRASTPENWPQIVGPFSLPEPTFDFKLLPVSFVVDLTAPLPCVEARFYAVNFLDYRITLQHTRFTLRVGSAPPLEEIPLVAHELTLDPKVSPMVTFRRNLSDAETRNLPWRDGRQNASFELYAKATAGDKTHSYGPVGSMSIDGWVNKPAEPAFGAIPAQ